MKDQIQTFFRNYSGNRQSKLAETERHASAMNVENQRLIEEAEKLKNKLKVTLTLTLTLTIT